MLFTTSWQLDTALLLSTILFLFYKYWMKNWSYWKDRGVDYLEPTSKIFGNIKDVIFGKQLMGLWMREAYKSTEKPYVGIFVLNEPYLVIRSPELIKDILIKDFNHFVNRSVAYPKHSKLLSNLMFFQVGEEWKITRSKFTPAFSTGKVKNMCNISNKFAEQLVNLIKSNSESVYVREIIRDYVVDVVSKCFFGVETYCLEHKESEFKAKLDIFETPSLKTILSQACYFFRPGLVKLLRLDFGNMDIIYYLTNVFREALEARENSNIVVHDLVDIINNLKKDKQYSKNFNYEGQRILGQPFQLFIAGESTTTSTITFALYELAMNPDTQLRLREDVQDSLEKFGGITYESLKDMKYMDMCVNETLRKYPTLVFLDRKCNTAYKIKDSDLIIPEGQCVYIPLYAIQHDENYFPEPEKFIPERFSDKSLINVNGLNFLPFGAGPRSCIGERLGLINVKLCLAHLVSNFDIQRLPETPVDLVYNPRAFGLQLHREALKLKFVPL